MLVCHAKSSFLCRSPAARHLTLDATGMVYGSLRLIVRPTEFLVVTAYQMVADRTSVSFILELRFVGACACTKWYVLKRRRPRVKG
jgi:hypothetical protein